MVKKIFLSLFFAGFASIILFISILRSASVRYEFNDKTIKPPVNTNITRIDYYLPFPGKVLPDSFLWPMKVVRDKIWLFITTDKGRKGDLILLFADKRIAASQILFNNGKPALGYSALEKSQMYLVEASEQSKRNGANGVDTNDYDTRLAFAALKHYEVMENILKVAPEDAKPKIIEMQNIPKKVFEASRNSLLQRGIDPPNNPFIWN